MRVLLIDDCDRTRAAVRAVLAQMGLGEVTEAGDGRAGLEAARAGAFELVLVDWNMPVMDGPSFVRAYRASGGRAAVVMLSSEGDRRRVVEAIRAGVDNYVLKPFTPDMLGQRIEETLGVAA